MTAALAWLLDRSPVFTRSFVRLFFDEECLERVTKFGTRTIVSLNAEGGGMLYPDLSLVGDGRLFELLVEVKVGATPNEYPDGEQVILQPDMYVRTWRRLPPATQASVRRVGTLTKGFPFPPSTDEWRARDVTWLQVRDQLRRLAEDGCLGVEVMAVAHDLVSVIGSVVLREPLVSREHQDALVEDGFAILERVRELLTDIGGVQRPKRFKDYAGLYIRREGEFQLWLFVTPEGGRHNRFGHPDAVGIQLLEQWEMRYLDEARARAGGFERSRDLSGTVDDRIYIDLETSDGRISDRDGVAREVAERTMAALRACDPPLV